MQMWPSGCLGMRPKDGKDSPHPTFKFLITLFRSFIRHVLSAEMGTTNPSPRRSLAVRNDELRELRAAGRACSGAGKGESIRLLPLSREPFPSPPA